MTTSTTTASLPLSRASVRRSATPSVTVGHLAQRHLRTARRVSATGRWPSSSTVLNCPTARTVSSVGPQLEAARGHVDVLHADALGDLRRGHARRLGLAGGPRRRGSPGDRRPPPAPAPRPRAAQRAGSSWSSSNCRSCSVGRSALTTRRSAPAGPRCRGATPEASRRPREQVLHQATLSRTSCMARSCDIDSLNCTKTRPIVLARERLDASRRPLMPATASSMGLTTCVSISVGPGPAVHGGDGHEGEVDARGRGRCPGARGPTGPAPPTTSTSWW